MKKYLDNPLTVILITLVIAAITVVVFDYPLPNAILIFVAVLLGYFIGNHFRRNKK